MLQEAGRPSQSEGLSSELREWLPAMHVLIVDNDSLLREGMQRMFYSRFGMENVHLAVDGDKALERIEQQRGARRPPYDIIITDVRHPGASASEIFAAGQAAWSGYPIYKVLFTAEDMVPERWAGMGAHAYVRKPSSVFLLEKAIFDAAGFQANRAA